MAEAPDSFRKTLRGRIVERDGRLDVRLPAETLVAARSSIGCAPGTIRRVLVIGQGSAHVAGQSLARVLREALGDAPGDGRGADRDRAVRLRAARPT